jgi:flagellar hook-associated protein FlgK
MDTSFNISLSGLNAASLRLSNSANNVANQNTPNYNPSKVVQESVEPNGGVKARIVAPATSVNVSEPNNPNIDNNDELQVGSKVDLTSEVVQQKIATYNFKGSLKVLQASDEMLGSLLDINA